MGLDQIFQPIHEELKEVEKVLEDKLMEAKNKSILNLNRFLLESPGKRLRPALVIFCAKVHSNQKQCTRSQDLIKIASCVELIHMASLIHDDVIDHAHFRHNKPTINSKWGSDVSITLGDYLYSVAFELISSCRNTDILSCIASATKAMCEGELLQVCERDNLDLLKERYIIIAKKKTASLFVAACQAGAILSNSMISVQRSLKGYGLNFGIAFQIIDDYLDLIGKTKDLGKTPGADFKMGELTLPILNLLSQSRDKNRIISLIRQQHNQEAFEEIKKRFINSAALLETKKNILSYLQEAQHILTRLKDTSSKKSLLCLTDFLRERIKI